MFIKTRYVINFSWLKRAARIERITANFTKNSKWFQKGTGKWTGIAALNYDVPLTLIGQLSEIKATVF